MLRVLRMAVGDTVRLFDGQGREGLFRFDSATKKTATLIPLEITEHPAPVNRTTVAVGWSRQLRRGWLLEKTVELETSGVWFWQGDHSQGKIPAEAKESWHGQAVAGAKQCGNPWLPEIRAVSGGVEGVIEASGEFDRTYMLWEDQTQERFLTAEDLAAPGNVLFILGPEGGFSRREADLLLDAGITPVSLGRRVLRWETAALLCLGLRWWIPSAGLSL